MSYRFILGLASGQDSDRRMLGVAAGLARTFEAEARILPCASDPAEALIGYGLLAEGFSPELNAEVQAARKRTLEEIQAATHKAADTADVAYGEPKAAQACVTVVDPSPTPWMTLLNEAPLADLVVVAREAATQRHVLSALFGDALVNLRLPMLLANGSGPPAAGTAVVAWNGSLEAGRAIRCALPLLLQSEKVIVAQSKHGIDFHQNEAAALDRCLRYLRRQGVGPLESLSIEGHLESSVIMDAAKDVGAALLVAGAYGHPRWQEQLLGGFTRTFLQAEDGPHLLICH
jgi:nucleotide-binding universal stress UspA family protein